MNDSLTIRVSRSTHALLREIASQSNGTITAVVDEAVRDLKRKKFWAEYHAACEALRADPEAWADLQREDAAWDDTLADGLESDSETDALEPKRGGSDPR